MDPDAPSRMQDGPPISPAGRRPLAVLAWVCALASPLLLGLGIALGIVAMVLGSSAHLKGDRYGMPAAVAGGIGCIVAMALVFLLRP